MKVALTGATGFIGRHVLNELRDRVRTIVATSRDARNLIALASHAQVVSLDMDDQSTNAYKALGRPDILIHLAWGGLPNYKSSQHLEVELPKQITFLKALVESGLPALLVTGTCFEYGMSSGQLREDQVGESINPYGLAKAELRSQLLSLRQTHPFDLTWARLFYTYGEGQSKNSLLSQLKTALDAGQTTFNMSGGEQLRDYLPIETVARLIVDLAMKRSSELTVNVCSGKGLTVRSFVEEWLRLHNRKIALNLGHYPYPDYEPFAFWGDRQLLDAVLQQGQ